MQLTIQYFDESKNLIKQEKTDSLLTMFSNVSENFKFEDYTYLKFLVDEDTLLTIGIDDLLYEYNLDTIRMYDEVIDFLINFYPQEDTLLYLDLAQQLPVYIKENLPLREEIFGSTKSLNNIHHVDFGELRNREHYSVDQDLGEYELRINVTNVYPNYIAVCLVPEYGATRARVNMRNLAELDNYSFSLANKFTTDKGTYISDLNTFISYSKYPRGL
jgi:hypothetical protein